MSAFTDGLYTSWLRSNGCHVRRGYGAQPHGRRLEGYPTNQTTPADTSGARRTTGCLPVNGAPSRDGSQRAKDAAARHEKPAVQTPPSAIFLPGAEKSSIETKA